MILLSSIKRPIPSQHKVAMMQPKQVWEHVPYLQLCTSISRCGLMTVVTCQNM